MAGNTDKYKILKPRYYDKFACSMSKCDDNCCRRMWAIPVDKATYDKYKKADIGDKYPELKKKLKDSVKRVRGADNDDFIYAKFVMSKQGECPFFTQAGLCEIHRDLGEEYLGATCRSYPRCHRVMSADFTELSVSMSCPEAVKIALFDENPMDFVIDMVEMKNDDPLIKHITIPSDGEKKTQYLGYAAQMREAAVTIMQNRGCSVACRIVIIAMMLLDVKELHDAGEVNKIQETLDHYAGNVWDEQFARELEQTPQNEEICKRLNAILYFAVKGEAAHPQSTLFAKLMEKHDKLYINEQTDENTDENSEENITGNKTHDIDNDENQDKDTDNDTIKRVDDFYDSIKQNVNEHWDKFLEKYEHVLENYLVNYMFSEIFPVKFLEPGLAPYHHVFILAQQYAMLRMLLCGNLNAGDNFTDEEFTDDNFTDEEFTDEYITKTISQLALIFQHTQKPYKIAASCRDAKLDTPMHVYCLCSTV